MEIVAGRWRARMTAVQDAGAALALRARVFRAGRSDRDGFDEAARHLLIEDAEGLVACVRLSVQVGADVLHGYTGQFYDLERFSRKFRCVVEVGRVCVNPDCTDPDVPRILLAMLARVVSAEGADALYGCTSFPMDAAPIGRLHDRVAPPDWLPGHKSRETRPLDGGTGQMPPLLRSYLSLGARVSDHAVVDRDLGTLHVFTALPIATIPPARARLLTGLLASA